VSGLTREIGQTIGGWLVGQAKIAFILMGIYAAGFSLSGVPWWPLVAVFGGLMQFVPIVGSLITLLIAALAVALAEGELYHYLGVLITFVVAQGLEGFYLTPRILGRQTKLSPWMVFLGILFGGMLFGPLGLVLAVPALAVAAVFWRRARAGQAPR
jgi:predicted PurR-regulated permease PerM